METIKDLVEDFKKYKWFYTSSKKLVLGGKSAKQNDSLLKRLKDIRKPFILMHTSEPGSPFSVILSEPKKVTEKDLEQAAIFTGCFSRAWKLGKKTTTVDIFKTSQIHKDKKMKTGTWGVTGNIIKTIIKLELVLTIQKKVLRAVPEKTIKIKKNKLLKIYPGKIDKKDMLPKLHMELGEKFSQEEILSALPAGGIKVSHKK